MRGVEINVLKLHNRLVKSLEFKNLKYSEIISKKILHNSRTPLKRKVGNQRKRERERSSGSQRQGEFACEIENINQERFCQRRGKKRESNEIMEKDI